MEAIPVELDFVQPGGALRCFFHQFGQLRLDPGRQRLAPNSVPWTVNRSSSSHQQPIRYEGKARSDRRERTCLKSGRACEQYKNVFPVQEAGMFFGFPADARWNTDGQVVE